MMNPFNQGKVDEGAVRSSSWLTAANIYGYVSKDIKFLKKRFDEGTVRSTSKLTAANIVMLVETRRYFAIRSTCQSKVRLIMSVFGKKPVTVREKYTDK